MTASWMPARVFKFFSKSDSQLLKKFSVHKLATMHTVTVQFICGVCSVILSVICQKFP